MSAPFFKNRICLALQEIKAESPTKVVTKKEVNQWYDVGIIKGTSCIVSNYHLPSEAGQGNGDVSVCIAETDVLFCSLLLFHVDFKLLCLTQQLISSQFALVVPFVSCGQVSHGH